jgi:hypothetical protein
MQKENFIGNDNNVDCEFENLLVVDFKFVEVVIEIGIEIRYRNAPWIFTIDTRENGVVLKNRLAAFYIIICWASTFFSETKKAELVSKRETQKNCYAL